MKMIFIGGPLHLTSHNVSGSHFQMPIMPPPTITAYDQPELSADDCAPMALYDRADFRSSVMLTGGKGEDPLEVVFAELERTRAALEKVKGVLRDCWENPFADGLRPRVFSAWREIEKP